MQPHARDSSRKRDLELSGLVSTTCRHTKKMVGPENQSSWVCTASPTAIGPGASFHGLMPGKPAIKALYSLASLTVGMDPNHFQCFLDDRG